MTAAFALLQAPPAATQKASASSPVPKLPLPSGPFGVGRVAFDWIDPTRAADMADDRGPHAELMVYLWYPAKLPVGEVRGVLVPGAREIDAAAPDSNSLETTAFGGNWPLVVSGSITSHVQDGAAIAERPKDFPVVIFSPGAYMTSFEYTSAIEDLVSHGYVVAAVEHTSEVSAVIFPDGKVHIYSPARIPKEDIPPPGSTPEEYEAKLEEWYRHNVDVRAADISFVPDKLMELNRAPEGASQFSGRLDVNHVGVVGHSRGGWAAIIACRRDARFKACVNEDGNAGGQGLDYPGAAIPTQQILYAEVSPVLKPGTTAADWIVLKQLHLTADEWMDRWHQKVNQEFESFPDGGYFVKIKGTGFEHYSFSDEVVLRAAKEGSSEKEGTALHNLRVTEGITRSFLDEVLRNQKPAMLHDDADMTVEHFRPAN
jgi:predicted dienelactone hydrolase